MITKILRVILWEKEIGRLSWDNKRGIGYFEYNHDFLRGNLNIFPIIAPINNPLCYRPILGDKDVKLYHHLPPFIADSLPDAWGNQVFEYWRKEQGLRNQEITPLDLLAFIGKRGMGALEFIPETSGIKGSKRINLESLAQLAHHIFEQRQEVHIEPDKSLTMQSLIAVGTSAGGRQPKAIIAINPLSGEVRSGQIAGQKGFEYYIIKFGDSARSSSELEMTYYDMANLAGIDMMPSRLIDVDGTKHFITKRFDRDGDCKIHMQTLAAINPDADSYEKLMMTCRKLRLPQNTLQEVFRRMVFNILANNTDDHNKNFAFLMDKNGNWRLAPAYDLTYIFNTGGFLPETTHCMLLQGKLSHQTLDDALALANENDIHNASNIIRQVADAIAQFSTIAQKYGVHKLWIDSIVATLNERLSSWGLINFSNEEISLTIDDRSFSNIRIVPSYTGNYHLFATENGRARKYVIGKNNPLHSVIRNNGINNLSLDTLCEIISKSIL